MLGASTNLSKNSKPLILLTKNNLLIFYANNTNPLIVAASGGFSRVFHKFIHIFWGMPRQRLNLLDLRLFTIKFAQFLGKNSFFKSPSATKPPADIHKKFSSNIDLPSGLIRSIRAR